MNAATDWQRVHPKTQAQPQAITPDKLLRDDELLAAIQDSHYMPAIGAKIEFILHAVVDLEPLTAGDPARRVEFLIHKHNSRRTLPYYFERLDPILCKVASAKDSQGIVFL